MLRSRFVDAGIRPNFDDWRRDIPANPCVTAALALGAAWVVKRIARPEIGEFDASRRDQMARLVESIFLLWRPFPGRERTLMWVDHEVVAHSYERQAFHALGIATTASASPAQALAAMALRPSSVVVSRLDHPGEKRGALRLLDEMRALGVRSPLIIYDSVDDGARAEARRRGALDATASPQELLRLVNQALLMSLSGNED
jgi:CheY-like chemotaxis protein